MGRTTELSKKANFWLFLELELRPSYPARPLGLGPGAQARLPQLCPTARASPRRGTATTPSVGLEANASPGRGDSPAPDRPSPDGPPGALGATRQPLEAFATVDIMQPFIKTSQTV